MLKSMSNLIELLQDSLNGRRYLIVLDDLWSTHAINIFIRWLPDYGNGCKLLLITRDEEVATSHSTGIHQIPFHRRTIHHVPFLNNEESWILLWQNVFADKYDPQLEKAGRKIAEKCEGLPLLILTVANILCGMEKTLEWWEKVADQKTTTFTEAYDQILEVLHSSYDNLPQHLKACFLYMGVLPQSCEIPFPKLINLWAVEDFREPWVRAFEDYAVECMRELVSRSLAIVCKESSFNRIKSSKLHSAYWYLCVKEARKNKFFHVLKKFSDGSNKDYIESQRRLSIQNSILFGIKEVYNSIAAASTTRSLLCTGDDHEYPVPICLNLVLLKVLDALSIRLYEFPIEVVKLLQLRYLALTHNGKVPPSISKLKQLQYLTVRQHHNIKLLRDSTCLPMEIWGMLQLRYLHIMGNLPEPDPREGLRLPNLFMLNVNAYSCTEGVFRSTPYLRKLGVKIELHPDAAQSISYLKHVSALNTLESLKCVVMNPRLRPRVMAPPDELFNLPRTLKKLSLNGLGYSWEHISAIGSLPYLQVLKLRCSAFQGPEWKTMFGGFSNLEHLLLEDVDLVHWTAEDKCFECLQRLIIRHCYKLKEIPPQIGVISSLKKLEVVDCSPSVVASVQKINYSQVVIESSWNLRR